MHTSKTMIRPEEALQKVSKHFPGAWEHVSLIFKAKALNPNQWEWPKACFLPMDAWVSIARDIREFTPSDLLTVPWLAACGTWRYTKGVYRFDQTLYEALIDTPVTGNLPAELLMNLPEWCVYIETPGMTFNDRPSPGNDIYGIFAHIDYSLTDHTTELRLLLDSDEMKVPIPIEIGNWTIEEGLKRMLSTSAAKTGVAYRINDRDTGEAVDETNPKYHEVIAELAAFVAPVLSLILYLCSEEKDVMWEGKPIVMGGPKAVVPTKTKKGLKMFQQEKARNWDVGVRIGSAIRRAMEKEEHETSHRHGEARGPMRPHVRKAHWHTYWRGGRHAEDRRRCVHWLSPMLVNISDFGKLPSTIHPVLET